MVGLIDDDDPYKLALGKVLLPDFFIGPFSSSISYRAQVGTILLSHVRNYFILGELPN